jgi:hypothetical protein
VIEEYLSSMAKGCDANRIDYVRLSTDQPLGPALAHYLIRRKQSGRG